MRMISLFVAAMFLTHCAPAPDTGGTTSENIVTTTGSGDDTEETCRAKGGTFRPVCLMGLRACVMKYADGGKPCTGKAQCEGQCRLEGPPPMPGATATGACQRASDPCGCFTVVEDGKAQAALCVD